MKKYYKYLIGSAAWLLPMLVFGANSFDFIFIQAMALINLYLIPLLIGVAALTFLWGVYEFISSAGDEEKRKTGKNHIIYGLIGLVVMIAFWGLVATLQDYFGIKNVAPTLPKIPQA
jgi:hypothetical protein